MSRVTKTEIVNMIMIEDKAAGKVVVLDKVGSWAGLTFPGGHVEPGESFIDSAVREAREETGLDPKNVVPCGVINWGNRKNGDRYLEFLYKADEYSGTLLDGTEEGKIFWMDKAELIASDRLSPNFNLYLPMFFDGKYSELYFDWDGEAWTADPQYK